MNTPLVDERRAQLRRNAARSQRNAARLRAARYGLPQRGPSCPVAAPLCERADYLPTAERAERYARRAERGNGAITLDDCDASGAVVITLIGADA